MADKATNKKDYGVHDCKLKVAENIDVSCREKFFSFFMKHLTVSNTYARSTLYFKSKSSIRNEIKRHTTSSYWYIIHPMSNIRVFWETLICLTLIVFFTLAPVDVFDLSLHNYGHHRPSKYSETLFFVQCIFAVDILVTFVTGYCDRTRMVVELHPKNICKRYLAGHFILDMLCTAPIIFYAFYVQKDNCGISYFIVVMSNQLRLFSMKKFKEFFQRITERMHMNYYHFRIIYIVVNSAIIFHWSASFAFSLPFMLETFVPGSVNGSWISDTMANLNKSPTSELYLRSFHFVTTIILFSSPVDRPDSPSDYIINLLFGILGICYMGILFVELLYIVRSKFGSALKYYSFMTQLQDYMRHMQLPRQQQKKLIAFYEHRYKHAYFKEGAILSTLSERLRNEIVNNMREQLLQQIFDDLPKKVLREVGLSLTTQVYLPGDMICKAGNTGNCMYFIVSGTVAVYTPSGKEISHLQDGDYFGEICLLLKDHKRIATVVAVEFCKVYLLDRNRFSQTIAQITTIHDRLLTLAKVRIRQTKALEALHRRQYAEEEQYDEEMDTLLD